MMQDIYTNKGIDAVVLEWQLSGVNQTVNRRPIFNVGANQIGIADFRNPGPLPISIETPVDQKKQECA